NLHRPPNSPPVYIIPGNRVMAKLYDEIQQGLVPGVSHISQLFTDGVHANDTCAYLVTLIHYACIFNANPIGLSNELQPGIIIPPSLASYLQDLVWRVVTSYPRSGLTHLAASLSKSTKPSFEIFLVPSTGYLWIHSPLPLTPDNPIHIVDSQGRIVKKAVQQPLFLGDLPKGMYQVSWRGEVKKFIKQE
ncbi:MAG: hypothetical protein RMJ66_08710, partial [Bacteroidia bacterium]|nr:hypothetical protein [Bacteroidia bacterium]